MAIEAPDQMTERALRGGGAEGVDFSQFQGARSTTEVSGAITIDTRANRQAAVGELDGDEWHEQDSGWTYYYLASAWHYKGGIYYGTDAQRAAITPTAEDVGALFITSDTTPKKFYRVSSAPAWALIAILIPATGAAITDYTDNVAGAVSNTLAAIPDPADSPATADALRDDIVANILPVIRNALSSIAAKQNTERQRLRDAGIIA